MLYLSLHCSKKGTPLSVSPNLYALSICNLKLSPDLRFAEIGHEEVRTHNEGPQIMKADICASHYKSDLLDDQSQRKGLLALYNFCDRSRGSIQIENFFAEN